MIPRDALARSDLGPGVRVVSFRPAAVRGGLAGFDIGPGLFGHFHDVVLAGLEPGHVVVLDLASLEFLTGGLLGLLLRARKAVQQRRARLVLAGASRGSLEVLRVSRLEHLFELAATPAEVAPPADAWPGPAFTVLAAGQREAYQSP